MVHPQGADPHWIATEAGMTGRLIGVGVGPGDPGLVTVKAAEALGRAPVIAYLAAKGHACMARMVAERYFNKAAVERSFFAPMQGSDDDLLAFYAEVADALAGELDANRDVAFLCLGDPLFYGSFSYLLPHLQDRYPVETIPGITSFNAGMAKLGLPLVLQEDRFAIMPAEAFDPSMLDEPHSSSIVLMKLGHRMPRIREALGERGLIDCAFIASRIGWPDERISRLAGWGDAPAPYMSLMIIQKTTRRR
jgi:precorrin-2 C(20)-methyltransferase